MSERLNMDVMVMATDDLVFSEPRKRRAPAPAETPIAGDIQLTSTGNINKKQDTQSWWHMGTKTKKHTEPTQFDWAIKPKKAQGGLDFGLKISGSTMPFSGRKRVFL
jgi:hypothetical protein